MNPLMEGLFLFSARNTNEEILQSVKRFGKEFGVNIIELHLLEMRDIITEMKNGYQIFMDILYLRILSEEMFLLCKRRKRELIRERKLR